MCRAPNADEIQWRPEMISDLSVVVISISIILLCWAVVRINQKIDEAIRNPNGINDLDDWNGAGEPSGVGSRETSVHTPT
jgi:hypothetical protein